MMAANHSVTGICDNTSPDMFGALKQRLVRVQANIGQNYKNVIQGIMPFIRTLDEASSSPAPSFSCTNACLHPEHIEMAQLHLQRQIQAKGHDFIPCQLTNPTWCDKCGDFIWGLSKDCLRCQKCHYTCHHKCLHSVELDCASVCAQNNSSETDQSPLSTPKNSPTREPQPGISPSSVDITPEAAVINTSCNCSSALPVPNPVVVEDFVGDDRADNTNEKDETDSGYRSGTIPDEHLPKAKGQATLNREDMQKNIEEYNKHFPGSSFELDEKGDTFHGFLKVTLNLVRPITMSLGARPPSIYELLTKEHIVEQNTTQIAFYMPRDTVKSIHVSSTTTTKEVITSLLTKFHILDHPRKFAMYEQEFNKTKLVRLRRVNDKEFPLMVVLGWKPTEVSRFRLVLQENETGEIVWDGFSCVELMNFLKVLDREEEECTAQLQYKYKVMKRIISQRLKELRKERKKALENSPKK